jgi:hypothetical protein
MRKILKHISVFFLWLAGLTMGAHQIIPHDHHLTDPFSKQDNNCPVSNNKTGQKSGFPVHCHAFNDLASEKVRPYYISQNIPDNFIAFNSFPNSTVFELQAFCSSIINLQKPIFDSYTLVLSLLRAPPTLA